MFQKKRICENCRTGQEAYLLEPHMEACPHIDCWNNNACPFYVQMETKKRGIKKFFTISKKNF